MNKLVYLLIFLIPTPLFAQRVFEIKEASAGYNVRLTVDKCDETFCSGTAKYELFRKGQARPFQTIRHENAEFMLEEAKLVNAKQMYDAQSTVFFQDFNFDGKTDLGLRDGNNSGYGGPSYKIYLFSNARQKFESSSKFTDLAQSPYLGMFTVDKKKRVIRTFSKSGCCMHETEEYKVNGTRVLKVFSELEDATIADEKRVRVTTKRLLSGRWKTSVKYVKRQE